MLSGCAGSAPPPPETPLEGGRPLSAATAGGAPEEETRGRRRETWPAALSRLPPGPWPSSMSCEQRHHQLRIAVAQRIGLEVDAFGVRLVEPGDPDAGALEVFGFLADHENGIEPADRLELDHALAEAAFAGIHDLLDSRSPVPALSCGPENPDDWPRIQSASKDRMVSIAAPRSEPLPVMIRVLRPVSGRTVVALTRTHPAA